MKTNVVIVGDKIRGLFKHRDHIKEIYCPNCKALFDILKSNSQNLIFIDGDQFDASIIKEVKEWHPQVSVVLCLSESNIETGLQIKKYHSIELLIKPCLPQNIDKFLYLLNQPAEHKTSDFIANSPAMKKIIEEIKHIAQSESNVFITGESGTGKEEVAKMIHEYSKRSHKEFIKVNCAAVPDTLIESEFFGHEKGAFTGAYHKKPGRFELANEGTLLLDEITEIPLPLQAKLLRVVQELEFERLGGVKPLKVNVRLISTSNRDVKEALRDKYFREDLFYRLNVIPLDLPPLRNRQEDIIPLAEYFIRKNAQKNDSLEKALSEEAKEVLLAYNWPGNIRELSNVIEHAMVMDKENLITEKHLRIKRPLKCQEFFPSRPITLEELQKQHILNTLSSYQNNKTKAAKALGISVRTLRNKLKSYEY
ncbi:MAG: sigma-54 dependent transcriptional regulator [Simkaniaceae bacterium]